MLRIFGSPEPTGLLASLREVALFSTLSPRELKVVGPLIHQRSALAGEVIFDQGEEGQAIYIVFSGAVIICQQGQAERPIATVGPRGIFGELALIDGGLRSAQARAAEDCELGVMFRGDFHNLMESHASIATKISFQLAQHYAAIIRQMAAAKGRSE